MSSGGSGGSGTSQTSTNLPAWLTPYMQKALGSYGQAVYGPGFDPSNPSQEVIDRPQNLDQQVAGFTPDQLAAMDRVRKQTGAAQGLADQGLDQASRTLRGDYLDPASNPYLKGTYDAAAQSVANTYQTATAPGIMAAAQRAGQFGGSAMDESMALSRYDLGENLNHLATDIYGGNYANERNRQIQTSQQLPQTIESTYFPQQELMGIGAQNQEQAQAEIDTRYLNSVSQFEFPFNMLSGLLGAGTVAGGGAGDSRTKTSSDKGTAAMVKTGLSGGVSVICTELHRQHYMTDEVYAADSKYVESVPPQVVAGYHRFGVPLARLMAKSELVTMLVAPVGLLWGDHMRFLVTGQGKGNLVGSLLIKLGTPICRFLGRKRGVA